MTSDERNQVENMIPKIIKIISGKWIPSGVQNAVYIDAINYEFADKTKGKVNVFVANDSSAKGYFTTNDPKNPTDNSIVIQQNSFINYFTNLGGLIFKTQKFVAGDENAGIELLRKTLKHELIHAKDPALNHHFLKEPYDSNKAEIYYKSWTEFQTMTGQFFESIITGVDRIMSSNLSEKNIRKIEIALSNILNYFAGKTTELKQDTIDLIQNTQSRNLFQRLIKKLENITGLDPTGSGALGVYLTYITLIKKYNPKAYNEFLKDLYKIIDQTKDKINNSLSGIPSAPSNINLKEMQYINEAKRLQKLAGIITEDLDFLKEEIVSDDAIEKAIAQAVHIDPSKVDLNKIESGEPLSEEELNEIALTAAVTILGLIPIALNLVGGAANKIKQTFGINLNSQQKQQLAFINQNIEKKKKEIDVLDKANNKPAEDKARKELEDLIKTKDTQFGSSLANKLKSAGESLHHSYVYPIERLLAGIAYFQKEGSKLKDKHYREKVANILYAITMATVAGYGVLSHINHLAGVGPVVTTIADGVKGGKSISDIAQEILRAI